MSNLDDLSTVLLRIERSSSIGSIKLTGFSCKRWLHYSGRRTNRGERQKNQE